MQRMAKISTLEPLEYHISVQVSTLRLFYASTSRIFPTEGILFQFTIGHAFTGLRDFMLSVHRFSKISWKFRNRLPKLNFKYFKRTTYLVLKYLILWHSEQRHIVKFVVVFDPSIDRTKESLLLLAFSQYLDKSNVYEILMSGRWRVIQQIGGITVFSSSTVLMRESSEHEGISTLPGLIKSSIELETDLFAFSEMKGYFKEKTTQRL